MLFKLRARLGLTFVLATEAGAIDAFPLSVEHDLGAVSARQNVYYSKHESERNLNLVVKMRIPGFIRLTAGLAIALLLTAGCEPAGTVLPTKDSADHALALSAFRVGLAAYLVGDDARAQAKFERLSQLAPGEPGAWANWGVLALRQGQLELAAQRLDHARGLAPDSAEIRLLLGVVRSRQGQAAEAVAEFRKATELAPNNIRAQFAMADEIERQSASGSDAQAQTIIQRIVEQRPENLAAWLELGRIATKTGDQAALQRLSAKLAEKSAAWPVEAQEQSAALRAAVQAGDLRASGLRGLRLRNVLMRVQDYREDHAALRPAAGADTPPLMHPLRLQAQAARPAAPDTGLHFASVAAAAIAGSNWSWTGAIELDGAAKPVVAAANGERLVLASGPSMLFPGGAGRLGPGPEGVLQVDFSYDFKTDLVLAGAGGLRLWRQEGSGQFVDAGAASKLPRSVLDAAYTGAWAVDIEADGDLDIVLGSAGGAPLLLRNNGDGSFEATPVFKSVSGLRQLVWADLDGDGTPEAVLLDGDSRLHLFTNLRLGQFRERALPASLGKVKAVTIADIDNDGVWDIVVLRDDGAIQALTDRRDGRDWQISTLTQLPGAVPAGEFRLHAADVDNNGAIDLVLLRASPGVDAGAAMVWLGGEGGKISALPVATSLATALTLADLDGDGRLDLLGLSADGRVLQARSEATKAYHWQRVRPSAAESFGDQRINPFGVGGEVELRAGPLMQKQRITGPMLHFGLGEQTASDIVRVLWPNGVLQAEFDLKADQAVRTEQRLKGSCPFLFAFDGKAINFVKDAVPWGSAIGLRINNIGTARVETTEEWYRVGRDQLVARDGRYDLRITAELWEVYYYDHLKLTAVDHPPGTEVYVDERFAIPPVKPRIVLVETPRKLAGAVDDLRQDVTGVLAQLDGKGLDSFGRGQYQGVTRDHYVELDLGADAPADLPLVLIAHGSLRPTDSSINVALSQGKRWRPQGMQLEIPDGKGGWKLARDALGFPAGRKKIVLFDLAGLFQKDAPRKLRIRTNLEIYWDQIQWARVLPDVKLNLTPLEPSAADLHYRGYSVLQAPPAGAPEVPRYDELAGTATRWRNMAGYYTRYGDVRELLQAVDDRYVIMNAGDEMSFSFPEPPPPTAGWLRDFIIQGDGWIKDGDYNSTFSATVQPLPHHGERAYTVAPGRLEDEVAFRRHPQDWDNYHTRYLADDTVLSALRQRGRR